MTKKVIKKNKKNKTVRKSKYLRKNKKKGITGGSTIYYTDTDTVEHSTLTYNGVPFFRKVYINPPNNEEQKYLKKVETEIVKILMKHPNPNPNIVKYYDINDMYVDMEQVNTVKSNPAFFNQHAMTSQEIMEIQETMINVKDFLQELGIMYIDWKFDNIGKSPIDGKYKLFDFDASGLIDLTTKEWKLTPVQDYWSYTQAIKNGSTTPKEIDDWSFRYNIIEAGNKMINMK
jgi:serine/threonine protein kinase